MSYNINENRYYGYIYLIENDVNDKLYIGQTITSLHERWHGHISAAYSGSTSVLHKAMRKYGRDKFHMRQLHEVSDASLDVLRDKLNLLEQEEILNYHSSVYENGYNIEWGGKNKQVAGRRVCKYNINLHLLDSYISCEEAGRKMGIDGCTIYSCCKHDYYMVGGYIWAFEEEDPWLPIYEPCNQKPIYFITEQNTHINDYIINIAPNDTDKQIRLLKSGWDGRKIIQYNNLGEIINIFPTIVDAADVLKIQMRYIFHVLNGTRSHFHKMIFRYENDPFDKYPLSLQLTPISQYDLFGNLIKHYNTIKEAEAAVHVPSGSITDCIKRNGTCKGYIFVKYGDSPNIALKNLNMIILAYNNNSKITFANFTEVGKYFKKKQCKERILDSIKNNTMFCDYYWSLIYKNGGEAVA